MSTTITTADLLMQYLNVPAAEAARLTGLNASDLLQDAGYQQLLASLDRAALQESANVTADFYDDRLTAIKARYGLQDTIMSSYTLVNWTLGYLNNPDSLVLIMEQHVRVPAHVIGQALPELLMMLSEMGPNAVNWQAALVVLSLPLLAPNA